VYFLPEEFHQPGVSIAKYVNANAGFYPRFDNDLLKRLINDFELTDNKNLNQLCIK
jgi:ABC-2 type transport system ATP-binding protein